MLSSMLRERHTARRVASTRCAALSKVGSLLSKVGTPPPLSKVGTFPVQGRYSPVDRQTDVKTLPSLVVRTREVTRPDGCRVSFMRL